MSELRADVQKAIETEGMYLAFDPQSPNAIVPVVSQGGKLFAMMIDRELAPRKFFDRTKIHGPFWPLDSNLVR
jgi:hypothetical protein